MATPTHGYPLHIHCLRMAQQPRLTTTDRLALRRAAVSGEFGNWCEQVDGFGGVWLSLLEKARAFSRGVCPIDVANRR